MKSRGAVNVRVVLFIRNLTDPGGGLWSDPSLCRLIPREIPLYPSNRRLGGFQSLSGVYGKEKNIWSAREI